MGCKYCKSYEDNEIMKKVEVDNEWTFEDKWEIEILRYGQDQSRKTALLTLQCETDKDYYYTEFQIKYCAYCGELLEGANDK